MQDAAGHAVYESPRCGCGRPAVASGLVPNHWRNQGLAVLWCAGCYALPQYCSCEPV